MKLSKRQQDILQIVKENEPISSEMIGDTLGFSRATLRNDLSVLTMLGMLEARPKVGYFFKTDQLQTELYSKLFQIPVKEIMQPPRFLELENTVQEAISTLFLHDTGSLYVLDEHRELAGVISRKDLLRVAMSGTGQQEYPVAMIMTRMPNLVTVYPDEELLAASYKMMSREIDSLPVVDRENPKKVIGRLSKTMITHFFTNVGLEIQKSRKKDE